MKLNWKGAFMPKNRITIRRNDKDPHKYTLTLTEYTEEGESQNKVLQFVHGYDQALIAAGHYVDRLDASVWFSDPSKGKSMQRLIMDQGYL
jgi:hypothetical protein